VGGDAWSNKEVSHYEGKKKNTRGGKERIACKSAAARKKKGKTKDILRLHNWRGNFSMITGDGR